MSSWKILIDSVLPPRCPFTGEIVDSQGMVAPEAWKNLTFIAAPYCHACGFPFDFAVSSGQGEVLCPSCHADRPPYGRARSAIAYDDASRDFILGFKHGDRTEAVVSMIPWLRAAGADLWDGADLLVPVPLHRLRLLRRRYNQAALIAQKIGKDRGIPCLVDALIRRKATPSQGHLTASERQKNVRHAFSVNGKCQQKIIGKKIILVDDVYTTGATVSECVSILLRAGAASVDVLTLARVVKPSRVS